jgi:AcrR family transcriptional regulator
MADAAAERDAVPERPAARPLPPGLDLLWGRRERGRRGPRPGLSADAIVTAAMRLADAEGLEAVSMARVAAALGFTTMSLYRYVTNKDELLALMWNASALGAENLVIEGAGWRERLRTWAVIQRDMLDRHPWLTQMPMAAPPVAPNSLHFVERGLATLDGTALTDSEKIQIIGLLSSYTLSEARMVADAVRAAMAAGAPTERPGTPAAGTGSVGEANEADEANGASRTSEAGQTDEAGQATGAGETDEASQETGAGGTNRDGAPAPPESFEALLRELVDERTYPRLYRLAWAPEPENPPSEREQYLFGVDTILDGVQALVDRAG